MKKKLTPDHIIITEEIDKEYEIKCPVCGSKAELVNCVEACTKCDWWRYSSS